MEVLTLKFEKIIDQYNYYLKQADPRVESWLLMESCYPTIILTFLYLVGVQAGIMLMRGRKPLPCKWLIAAYNFVLILLNCFIFYELLTASYAQGYNYLCQSVDYSTNEQAIRIARALWWFYISKLIEFSDTFFFIARKKNNQISFLHVYHHATMFPLWWIGVKWVAGGQSVMAALINSFVHITMYSYYFLASLGPSLQPYLWWKRYLTIIQLIQFVVGVTHSSQSIYFKCPFPLWMQWALIFYATSIFILFINFYIKTYLKKGTGKNKAANNINYAIKQNGGGRNKINYSDDAKNKKGPMKNGRNINGRFENNTNGVASLHKKKKYY